MNNTEKAFSDNMKILCNAIDAAPVAIRRCDKCMWWLSLEDNSGLGECRKYAPRPSPEYKPGESWSLTAPGEWCGEYEYDASKDKET